MVESSVGQGGVVWQMVMVVSAPLLSARWSRSRHPHCTHTIPYSPHPPTHPQRRNQRWPSSPRGIRSGCLPLKLTEAQNHHHRHHRCHHHHGPPHHHNCPGASYLDVSELKTMALDRKIYAIRALFCVQFKIMHSANVTTLQNEREL